MAIFDQPFRAETVTLSLRVARYVSTTLQRAAAARGYTVSMALLEALEMLAQSWGDEPLAAMLHDNGGLQHARKTHTYWPF